MTTLCALAIRFAKLFRRSLSSCTLYLLADLKNAEDIDKLFLFFDIIKISFGSSENIWNLTISRKADLLKNIGFSLTALTRPSVDCSNVQFCSLSSITKQNYITKKINMLYSNKSCSIQNCLEKL